ncbi:hypothetical protein [Methylocystis parvus]|nr:hypothetical protein [Methylocystis parvus]WBJ99962.1 hypothetical protein MMG94_18580 [Methylocystis parvus OBBP]
MKGRRKGGGAAAALGKLLEILGETLLGPAPALRPVPVRRPAPRRF